MLRPWTLGAAGLGILGALYYISWTYVARWVCKFLLKGDVVFGCSKACVGDQNGINGTTSGCFTNHELGSLKSHDVAPTGAGSASKPTPHLVSDGVLTEIAQL